MRSTRFRNKTTIMCPTPASSIKLMALSHAAAHRVRAEGSRLRGEEFSRSRLLRVVLASIAGGRRFPCQLTGGVKLYAHLRDFVLKPSGPGGIIAAAPYEVHMLVELTVDAVASSRALDIFVTAIRAAQQDEESNIPQSDCCACKVKRCAG